MDRKVLAAVLGSLRECKVPPGVNPRRWKPLGEDFGVAYDCADGKAMGQFLMCVDGQWRPFHVQCRPDERDQGAPECDR